MYKFLNRLIDGLKRLAGKQEQSAKLPTYIGGYIPPSAAYGRCGVKAKFRDHSNEEIERYARALRHLQAGRYPSAVESDV